MSYLIFARWLDNTSHSLRWILILVAFGAWLLAFVYAIRRNFGKRSPLENPKSRRPLPGIAFVGMAVFVGIIGFEFLVADIVKRAAWKEIQPQLADQIEVVMVDGRRSAHGGEIVAAMRKIGNFMAHHSHPTNAVRLTLRTASHGDLELVVRRDSGNPQEYWVFYPKYHVTAVKEIGRVFTDVFDGLN